MKKGILFSLLTILCLGWVSAQSAMSDKRVEKFRVSAAELPSLLEDLDLDPSLAETVATSGDVEVMRITEPRTSRPNAFFFDRDDRHNFNGIFEDLEIEMDDFDFDFDLLELERSTEQLGENMERLAEELERNGERIQKRIKMRINRDGNDETIEWDGEGELPLEIQEKLDALEEELDDLDFDIAVEVEEDIDPWIMRGVEAQPLLGVYHETHEDGGVLITGIVDDSGAQSAGIQEGDRITAFDGNAVNTADELRRYIKSKKVGDELLVSYMRDGKNQTVTATLGENEQMTSWQRNNWKHHNMPHLANKKTMLGVELDMNEDDALHVTRIHIGSNAERLGIEEDDVLLKMNGQDLTDLSDLRAQKETLKDGDKTSVTVNRNGSEVRLSGIWKENKSMKERFKKNKTFFFEPAPKDKEIIIIRPVENISLEERNIGFTNINVFPNPSSGNINVDFSGTDAPATIRISDLNGTVIFEQDTNPVNGQIRENITLDTPISGTLFVSVIQGTEIHTQRLVNN